MAKKRVHYIKVGVTFDKPVGQNKAIKEIRTHIAKETYYTAPDLVDGAETFKIASIVAEKNPRP